MADVPVLAIVTPATNPPAHWLCVFVQPYYGMCSYATLGLK